MKFIEEDKRHLVADEGKVLRRKSDGMVFGEEVFLGYTYYLNGEKLDEPLYELPEHYEEVESLTPALSKGEGEVTDELS